MLICLIGHHFQDTDYKIMCKVLLIQQQCTHLYVSIHGLSTYHTTNSLSVANTYGVYKFTKHIIKQNCDREFNNEASIYICTCSIYSNPPTTLTEQALSTCV